MRPSAIGHFFSRIGSTKRRNKNPRDPSPYMSDDALTPYPTQPTSPVSPVSPIKNVSIRNFKNVNWLQTLINTQRNYYYLANIDNTHSISHDILLVNYIMVIYICKLQQIKNIMSSDLYDSCYIIILRKTYRW